MESASKNYKVKFSFLSFIIIFLLLIPLDLNRFWLRDNISVIGGLFNFWGNVFDSVLVGLTMTFITTSLVNIKLKDAKTMKLSLAMSAIFFTALANLFSETAAGQHFLISNFSPTLKNISDPWDFITGVLVATPLILIIVKLKAYDEPQEVDYEFDL
jgi:hypothetical protein